MKTRQRILIPFTHGHSGAALLRRAGDIAAAESADLLVVSGLDTRSCFDLDGPAGSLPGERAARLAPAEQQRLERDLSRHGLDQAQATVIWGEPRAALAALIERWRPDTIVCDGPVPDPARCLSGRHPEPEYYEQVLYLRGDIQPHTPGSDPLAGTHADRNGASRLI